MVKTHNQYVKALVLGRTEEIIQEIRLTNQRYQELYTEIDEVQAALTDNLPPQLQSLVRNRTVS
jgi:hypothetical protein